MKTWIVQSNLGNSRELRAISDACAKIGARCLPIEAIPFDDSPLRLPGDLEASWGTKDVVAYGTVRFVQRVHRLLGPSASLYDPDGFNTQAYRDRWGSNMLNRPKFVCPLSWIAAGWHEAADCTSGDDLFVRPASDLKPFSGSVVRRSELQAWAKSLGGTTVDIEEQVEVSAAVKLEVECRLWIVDGRAVAGVVYRGDGRLIGERMRLPDDEESSDEARDLTMLAEACARCWSPARAFVMDLCYVSEGDDRPRIVEAGCLTSAGFYNSGVVEDVVRAVSTMPEVAP